MKLTNANVVEGDEPSNEFTVEEIMSSVDRPQAAVRVVVCVHAETKRPLWNNDLANFSYLLTFKRTVTEKTISELLGSSP